MPRQGILVQPQARVLRIGADRIQFLVVTHQVLDNRRGAVSRRLLVVIHFLCRLLVALATRPRRHVHVDQYSAGSDGCDFHLGLLGVNQLGLRHLFLSLLLPKIDHLLQQAVRFHHQLAQGWAGYRGRVFTLN